MSKAEDLAETVYAARNRELEVQVAKLWEGAQALLRAHAAYPISVGPDDELKCVCTPCNIFRAAPALSSKVNG